MPQSLIALQWLKGRRLESFELDDISLTWLLKFDGNAHLNISCLWRLVEGGRISATSEDHGHKFGQSVPFDARSLLGVLRGMKLVAVARAEVTNDVSLTFESARELQLVVNSAAYEAWSVSDPLHGQVIAEGSELHIVAAPGEA